MSKTIDILVKAIDNFGDFGFALDIAEWCIAKNPETTIRFFGDNRTLFDLLTQKRISGQIVYFPLDSYQNSKPSETVILCFDMKAEMDFFMEQSYKIQIFILSYLRFDDKVASMNGTSYSLDNITITHLVPSPREDGGGIVVRRDLQDRVSELVKLGLPEARKKFFSEIGREIPPELLDSPWISVFCYPEGRKVIENFITAWDYPNKWTPKSVASEESPTTWIFFEDRADSSVETFSSGNSIWRIPYLRFDEYEILLSLCDRNIVRGENSAMKALLAGKPFLWDIYKESNSAHFGKLEEFFSLFITCPEKTKKLFIEWNTLPSSSNIQSFLQAEKIPIPSPLKDILDFLQ